MLDNFIGEFTFSLELCERLIKFHKESQNKFAGKSGMGEVQPEIKDSTDVSLVPSLVEYHLYMTELIPAVKEYCDRYNYFKSAGVNEITGINVQHYEPTKGYFRLHCERSPFEMGRELVFMTYLNTVSENGDEGGTAFPYQKYTAKAIAGNTLIWPAFFTHEHQGVIHMTKEKYIATGWLHLMG
jgi:prolyl 4-hydroxylase